MMDIDPDNARKYLTESVKNSKPLLDTESNYTFLEGFFEELAYEQKVKEFQKKSLPKTARAMISGVTERLISYKNS